MAADGGSLFLTQGTVVSGVIEIANKGAAVCILNMKVV